MGIVHNTPKLQEPPAHVTGFSRSPRPADNRPALSLTPSQPQTGAAPGPFADFRVIRGGTR